MGTAADGVRGIEAFEEGKPHLVVIDFLLPKKNGFAVAEAIRSSEHGARTQLVMMSGVFKNPKTAVEAREKYQVIEFLGKPIDLEHLGRLVDDALSLIPEDDECPEFGDKVERAASEAGVGTATLSDTGAILTGGSRPFPPLPADGSLEDVPVALVLSTARYDRLTGMIDLTDQGVHRRVYLLGGQPVFMQSNADGENVGALLLRRGRITEPDFERCLTFMKSQKKTLQQALLELKLATDQELATAYKLLAGQLLPMAVGMGQGTFHWRETDAFVGRVPEGQFDAVKVIFDGIKRYVHPPQIIRFFTGREDEPLRRSPEFDRMLPAFRRSFSADNVAALIDDRATYKSITRARAEEAATIAPQLFAMLTTGMCILPDAASSSQAPTTRSTSGEFNLSFADGMSRSTSSSRFGSVVTESPGTAEDRKARARVNQAYDDYMSRNFFETFDLPTGGDVPEERLRSAYFSLAKQWHEDAFVGLDLGMSKPKLDELFARIKEAYDTLTSPEKRGEYLVYLERQRRGLPTDIHEIFKAEQTFDEALVHLKRRDLSGAMSLIEKAIELNPGEAIFFAYKGWVTFLADKDAVDDAVNLIRRAVAEQENLPMGYQFLGQIGAAVGDMNDARKWFNKCLEYDPNNIEAARGIRMINSRDTKKPDSKSGIGGVFNRLRKK